MLRITTIVVSLILTLAAIPRATTVAQKGPPTDEELIVPIEGICAFTVLVEIRGKTKTIELPGGGTRFIFPSETVTFTNLDNPSRRETLGITGSIEQRFLENGDVELLFKGRNLVIGFDPVDAFVITIGHFSVAFDEEFNITQPLSGTGRVIDICQLLD